MIRGYGERDSAAEIVTRHFGRQARLWRAAAGLATSWGAAGLSVFIPVAHFLLVPGFLVFGMWLSWTRLHRSILIIDARGACPDCGTDSDFDLIGMSRIPTQVTCGGCRRVLTLGEDDAVS